jgi:hypothetical protein
MILAQNLMPACISDNHLIRRIAFDCIQLLVKWKSSPFPAPETMLLFMQDMAGLLERPDTAAFACQVIRRYALNFHDSGLRNDLESVFQPFSVALIALASSPDKVIRDKACEAAMEVVRWSPPSVESLRIELLRSLVQQIDALPPDAVDMEIFLVNLLGATAFSLRKHYDSSLLANAFDVVWAREVAREHYTYNGLSILGEILMGNAKVAEVHKDKLVSIIIEGQESQELGFQRGTVLLLGDLFRGIPVQMEPYAGPFIACLLATLEKITTPIEYSLDIINSLGDILKIAYPEVVAPFKDALIGIIEFFSTIQFDVFDKKSVQFADLVFQAVLYFSGKFLFAMRGDPDFIYNHRKEFFRLFLAKILKVEIFHSRTLHMILLRFVTDVTRKDLPTRAYGIAANNVELKKHLSYIQATGSVEARRQATELISQLGKM